MKAGRFLALASVAVVGAAALAESYVDTFDGGINAGSWTFGAPFEQIEAAGGNPGPFLHGWSIDSIFPTTRSGRNADGGIFTGNYRSMLVTSLGIDADLIEVDFPDVGNRPMTLALLSDNRTPTDFSDDWGAYLIGPDNIPYENDGWLSYDFAVPSQSDVWPADWTYWRLGPGSPADGDWTALMQNVSEVDFLWGSPELFYIFQMWDAGADNLRISWIPEPGGLVLVLALAGIGLRRR
jgi:hypothetical protein